MDLQTLKEKENVAASDMTEYLYENHGNLENGSIAGFTMDRDFHVTGFSLLREKNVGDFCHELSRDKTAKFAVLFEKNDVPLESSTYERHKALSKLFKIGRELADCGIFTLETRIEQWEEYPTNYSIWAPKGFPPIFPPSLDPLFAIFQKHLEIAQMNGFDVETEGTVYE